MEEARRDNPQMDYLIRLTDNSLKEGDLLSPQDAEPLELDSNGLPVGFAGWEAYDGDC